MRTWHWMVVVGILFGMGFTRISGAPINDNFANRTALTGTNLAVQGDNGGATTEAGENIGNANVLYVYSVWYEWTAPTNGILYVSGQTSVPNFIMGVDLDVGSSVSTVTSAPRTPDGGVPVTTGQAIEVKVYSIHYLQGGGGGGMGAFSLNFSLVIPTPTSTNDAFANRAEITTPAYHFDGSIYNATSEAGEPLPSGTSQTLWWDFAPPGNGILNLTISGAQFTPTLTVYDGNQFAAMQPVSSLKGYMYYLQAGHDYSIQMASGFVPGGNFSLDSRFYPQSNDTFATSDQVQGTNITYYGNFTMATLEPGEPVNGGTNTVWMTWVAPTNGYAQVNKGTAPQFQYYNVYTGSSVTQLQPVSLVPIGANSIYRFLVTAGTPYHFQFSGGADFFTFYLQFQTFSQPPNDNFANADVVKGNNVYYPVEAVNDATMELGEPLHMGNVPQKSLWWTWQAPVWGDCYINPGGSLVSNLVLAAYTGDSVDTLTLVRKATNSALYLPVTGGQTYHIAGAVLTNSIGDIRIYSQYGSRDTSAHIVSGNLLQEPSWEGTGIDGAQYWHWTGSLGGYVNEAGGADGTTWPTLGTGTTIWQDIPTIPGHTYAIHFAYELDNGGGDAQVAVFWDTNQLGVSDIPADEGFWHWATYTAVASNTTSRVSFQNLARILGMDAFSVVDATASPVIVTQPASISGFAGGTANFDVGATGTSPLFYQWFFNNSPIDGQTNKLLTLNSLTAGAAGNYLVVVANSFGAATSTVASLLVDDPASATILSEPYGDTVPVGGYFNLGVAAAGPPPLTYQWYLNNVPIAGATNANLMLTNVQTTDAGAYLVQVGASSSVAWSLPATLTVSTSSVGGGVFDFRNRNFFSGVTNIDAPIFDLDGTTLLSGSQYLAQLYAGPSLDRLRPAGQPTPFQTGGNAGFFVPQTITLANVAPGDTAYMQVCAWDASYGTSYEQARATGGRFGKSGVLEAAAGGGAMPPQTLLGLQSFSLQAGLPYFEVGTISFVQLLPPQTMVWAVHGQPNSLYLIEKSERSSETIWHPFTVVTNISGTVTFTDTSTGKNVWYRARILD